MFQDKKTSISGCDVKYEVFLCGCVFELGDDYQCYTRVRLTCHEQ